jgi:hypothetical protein
MAKSKPVEIWVQMAVLAIVITAGSWYLNTNREVPPRIETPVTGDELELPASTSTLELE